MSTAVAPPRRPAWGDRDDDEDEDRLEDEEDKEEKLVQREETQQKDGTFKVIERFKDPDGNTVEVTKIIKREKRTKKVKKGVLERKNWFKFGDCKGAPPGPEMSITMVSNEKLYIDLSGKVAAKETKGPVVTCPICGERGHFRFKCPRRNDPAFAQADSFSRIAQRPAAATGATPARKEAGGKTDTGRAKYVPPSQRSGQEELPTLRVTNISEVTTERDLAELFEPFGRVNRIYLARDYQTTRSRGFAFVTYLNRDDAEEAIARLNGYGYDNLILHVEWAKPREDKKES